MRNNIKLGLSVFIICFLFFSLINFLFFERSVAANLDSSNTITQACNYTYSDWSACQPNNTKVRIVKTYSPYGCNGNPELISSCIYSSTTTDTPGTIQSYPCTYTYSDWSACQPNGTKSRTVKTLTPENCTGTPEISATCEYVPTNCIYGYSEWSTCSSSGIKTRTVAYYTPSGCVGTPEISATCEYTTPACTYTYSDWSACKTDGTKTRTVTSYSATNCVGTPELTTTCEYTAPAVNCYYTFSDYGDCINGKKTRTITNRYPAGCIENLTEPLEKTCEVQTPETSCTYTYSDWSTCENGKKTRKIVSAYPNTCIIPTTLITADCSLEENCTEDKWQCTDWTVCDSTGIQKRECKIIFNCPTSPDRSPETTRTCVYKSPVTVQPVVTPKEEVPVTTQTPVVETKVELPQECLQIGWDNQGDCEIYLHKARVVSDCLDNNLTTRDQCRNYLIQKYGKPLKCEGLSEAVCINLINKVLLSDLQPSISPQAIKALDEVAGQTAVIDTQNNTIKVNAVSAVGGTATQTVIPVDGQPLASSSGNVQVSLLPISVDPEKQTLSPTAITFDSNNNGIPDDVESRIGNKPITDKVIASLTGVDKAIVTGQTLEQPKAIVVTPSASLVVDKVANVANAIALKFEGKAKPNTVVTLYIYSSMPIVVTVKTDANGNWVYDLDKTLVDGTHEVYVAVNDDKGRIVETSLPTPFFIEKAQAVSIDNFVKNDISVETPAPVPTQMITFYMFLSIILVALLILLFLIIRQRLSSN